jgi:hypothetical protein
LASGINNREVQFNKILEAVSTFTIGQRETFLFPSDVTSGDKRNLRVEALRLNHAKTRQDSDFDITTKENEDGTTTITVLCCQGRVSATMMKRKSQTMNQVE